MGNCASSPPITRRTGAMKRPPPRAMVIDSEGRLQEFSQPIKAERVLSELQYSSWFLCSSETMEVGSQPAPLREDDDLQPGHIYFLMPVSMSKTPLRLPDLCALAIKASSALTHGSRSGSGRTGSGFPGGPRQWCRVETGRIGMGRGGRRVGL